MDTQIRRIKKEYADAYGTMKWIDPETAARAGKNREQLIARIFENQGAGWMFAQTKLFSHGVSPGCALCGQGDWSCLFINGICNARCFYCPSAQSEEGDPVSSTVEFTDPVDYADYVKGFGIKGVSFSGGEPLMSFDRVMDYLRVLRKRISSPLYIWMYTNGILATEDKMKALRDAGLDEIRFDLSANDYRLDGLEKAVGVIPRVTVEIPAIPGDLDRVKALMPDLASAGVDFLNLHQIRCTGFNRPKLVRRGYTFCHGPAVTVLETELTALELICHGLENTIPLPVNYCAFTYRHQFQKAGARKRNAAHIKAPYEGITPTGMIRTLSFIGAPERIARIRDHLIAGDRDPPLWTMTGKGDRLFVDAGLIPLVNPDGVSLRIDYSTTRLRPGISFRCRFKEVALNPGKKVVVERYISTPGVVLKGEEIRSYAALYLGDGSAVPGPALPGELRAQLERFESFAPGLSPYF
ncbi:MAG: radical SAM protein [Desulfobacter sp.]|nr:MAG: radical SAM protein [Desulfobacter sp.]